ncbi:hypothetical protein ACH5RR_020881 [Cinchona calisaya]|uniref:Uncharacterized protein n=1 Tax=Cinchona calisaya TaxID=153742 RepID=A0ABD2ZFQ4_9GENT
MGCFPCAGSSSSTKKPEKSRKNPSDDNTNQRGNDDRRQPTKGTLEVNPNKGGNKGKNKATNPSAAADEVDASKRSSSVADANKSKYKIFQYAELESATENFKPENLLGEGGFGKVHKGRLVDTGQARPLFRDRNNFPRMADPLLEGRFPAKGIYQALAISSTCLHINPSARPRVQDVVAALDYLVSSSQTHDPLSHRVRISGESSSAANKPGTDDK